MTSGIGQKAMTLHPIMRPFSAQVKEDKMAGLLSDTLWPEKYESKYFTKLELQAYF